MFTEYLFVIVLIMKVLNALTTNLDRKKCEKPPSSIPRASLVAQMVRNLPAKQETQV